MPARNRLQGGSLFAPATPVWPGSRRIHQGGSLFQVSGGTTGQGLRVRRDKKNIEYSGDGRLRVPVLDAVTKDGAPVSFLIRVLDERNGVLVQEVWSDGNGQWLIEYIRRNIPYTLICYDYTGKYDPIAYSSVYAEAML